LAIDLGWALKIRRYQKENLLLYRKHFHSLDIRFHLSSCPPMTPPKFPDCLSGENDPIPGPGFEDQCVFKKIPDGARVVSIPRHIST